MKVVFSNRHKAREIAVATLYSLDFNNKLGETEDFEIFQAMNEDEIASLEEETKVYASLLINGTIENLDEIDSIISSHSINRPIEAIDVVDRNILRVSFFQLLFDKSTHPNIVIDEAVKLSQSLSNDVSYKFINGMLDRYVKEHNDPIKK